MPIAPGTQFNALFNMGYRNPWNTYHQGIMRMGNQPLTPRFGTPTKVSTVNGSTITLKPPGLAAFGYRKL